jgi:uncharacterized protein (DUF983 family)
METDTISTSLLTTICVVVIIEFIIKSFALWRAARRSDKAWYIVLLVVNTAGILPLIYLLTHKEAATVRS